MSPIASVLSMNWSTVPVGGSLRIPASAIALRSASTTRCRDYGSVPRHRPGHAIMDQ